MICKVLPINKFESRVVLTGQPAKYWFYEDFYEKVEPSKGIYRKFNESIKLCYRLDSVGTNVKDILPQGKSLFFYNNISYKGKKAYEIRGEKYVVHSYAEFEGSTGITSFYLENFGFIAYDLNNGYYLLCNRVSEYTNIKEATLKSICD